MMKTGRIPEEAGLWPCASTSGTSFLDTGLWTTSWAPWSAAGEPSSSSQRILSDLTGAVTSWTSPTSGFSMATPAETRPSWSCWNRCPRTTSPNASANCANSWAPPPTWSGLRRRRRSVSSGWVSATLWKEKRRRITERGRQRTCKKRIKKKWRSGRTSIYCPKWAKPRHFSAVTDEYVNVGWKNFQWNWRVWSTQMIFVFKW